MMVTKFHGAGYPKVVGGAATNSQKEDAHHGK